MNPERWHQIKRLYNSALEVEPGRREAFLEEACAGDESLQKEIQRLLARQVEAEDLLGKPAFEVAAQALAQDRKDEPQPDYVGWSLLHYRITEKIGEGGMGVVYKARDTHLDRTVAIKVLPAEAMADSERKRRFIQEAKAASALNHPNIIDIHDINSDAGVDFIVMEHVAGKTLDRRIGRRGMRIGEALKYAVQIADALAAAHAAGIVHRDLKPANIMVTETGLVKVLDFGLAKLTQPIQSEASGTVSSMESMTGEGRIIGTVAYMSPEQAEGRPVDARSDIFSFGSVLYEMLTGKQAFQSDSTISTLSAIIEKEPPPLNAEIPPLVERTVTRCLRKDPARRFQAMSDLKVELEELKEEAESGRLQVPPVAAKRASLASLAVAAFAVIALIAAGWYWLSQQRSVEPGAVLTSVPLTSYPGSEDTPSFSPDGTQVAFEWCTEGPSANCDIYIKQIGEEPPYRLTTDPAEDFSPAWSPDGKFVAFLRALTSSKAELRIIPQRGGQERVLEELNLARLREEMSAPQVAWAPDSKWLALPSAEPGKEASGLLLISVEASEKKRLTISPAGFLDCSPALSPDGGTLAFTRCSTGRSGICLLRLSENYEPQGEPQTVATSEERFGFGPAWTQDGRDILYCGGYGMPSSIGSKGLWQMPVKMAGRPTRLSFAMDAISPPAVSRQGNRLAYAVARNDGNIYRIDLGESGKNPGTPVKLISSTRVELAATYSPDGKKIAFSSDRSGFWEIWVCDHDGSNAVQLTSLRGEDPDGWEWSPDGRSIAFALVVGGERHVCVTSTHGGPPRRLVTVPAIYVAWPSWSRDGQWIYFRSQRSGMSEIWKVSAAGGEAVQITPNGTPRDVPRESPDGKFLYYLKLEIPGGYGVWRVSTGGGEESKMGDWREYMVGEDGIYFVSGAFRQGRRDLNFYDTLTGKTRKILTIESPSASFFSVSRDGRAVLYTQWDQRGSDLMLVEDFR